MSSSPFVRLFFSGTGCANRPIGTSDSSTFPHDLWTASSRKTGNEPYRARLDSGGAWAPATNAGADYLQIDLGAVHVICAVATQGNPNADEWTTKYKLEMSVNKVNWTEYKEGDAVKVRSSVHVLVEPQIAIMIIPTTLYRCYKLWSINHCCGSFLPSLKSRFSWMCKWISKNSWYSQLSANGHSRKRKALLTDTFFNSRFHLPVKLCIYTHSRKRTRTLLKMEIGFFSLFALSRKRTLHVFTAVNQQKYDLW